MNIYDASHGTSPFLTGITTVEEFSAVQNQRMEQAQKELQNLLTVPGQRTIDNTLRPYDRILTLLDAAGSQSSLFENVHPADAMRSTAEQFSQKVASFGAELSLNRAVYDALSAMDLAGADASTKFYVEKTLRDFRLAGVDKDEETRNRIKALRDELVLIGQDFAKNIREDVRTVTVNHVKELDGLPQDYINRHTPDANGVITLTVNYPDAVPVFTYAHNEDLRKRMYMQFNNRAYPKNMEVLDRLIAKRHELANLLGFPNWAACVTADKMVKSDKDASDFIDKIAAVSRTKSESDYAQLLASKAKDVPGAAEVNLWESGYYSELVRKSDFDFDGQTVRPYFQYAKVKEGILSVMGTLFDVTFKINQHVPVWHESVECYEMFENGSLTGRLYLDMHPRDNKYNHAAQFGIRNGVAGVQIPEAALICNFPGGDANDPGLMEHKDVETFFHEFGHLLHALFAGQQPWMGISGISTEWDFVEVPSQLLEEWAWDATVLQSFANHYQTGEPIPAALVERMRLAHEFGKGLQIRQQMFYAKMSLSFYDRDPEQVDTDALAKELRARYTPFRFVDGTHFQTSFGHLDGYSAIYYTYMWSLVIAKDFFTHFDSKDMMAPGVAKRYRDVVLAQGGSRPAAELVKEFLGRDFNFDGWKKWLEK